MNTRSDSIDRRDADAFPERFVPMPRCDPRPWRLWLRLWAMPTLVGIAWGAAAVPGVLLALIPLSLAALWCAATLTAGSMVAAVAPSSPC
jgi:hypothetical protein